MRNHKAKLFAVIAAVLIFGMGFGIQAKLQPNVQEKISLQQNNRVEPEGKPAPELIGYWQRFAANSVESTIVWSRQTGAAESIFGKLTEPGAISEQAARRFLSENAPLFKMGGDLQDLELIRNFESPMGRHFYFKQVYQGVPVYGAETAVHFNQEGRIVAVNNTYLPEINISVLPSVNLEMAMGTASLVVFANDFSQASSELVVYRFDGDYTLAWHIAVPTSHKTWELFIDAHSGAVLGRPRDINRYSVNGSGKVFRVNASVATQSNSLRDNNDAASAVPNTAYSTVTLQGLDGTGLLDGQYASSSKTKKRAKSASNNFVFDRSNDGFSEVMGYYYIDYAERYIQTTLGFTNVNNRQQVFSANGTRQDNSFYSPSTKQITYGTGGVDDAEDAEVILHEYGHSIQDNQVPGFGSGAESGAMGEGFGDYWGASVNAQLSNGFQDLCVAEWDATSYSSTNPPCLRRLDSTKHYPQDIDGEVHDDGEIWSAALWQIRTSLGAARADKLIIQHHFLLPANPSFNTAAKALVTAATNLGYTSAEINSIKTILQNRGFNLN